MTLIPPATPTDLAKKLAVHLQHTYEQSAAAMQRDPVTAGVLGDDLAFAAQGATKPRREAREALVRLAHRWAALSWQNAADHLVGMRALLTTDQPPTMAHFTLARTAIEGAALTHWLCAPGDPAEVRMCRAVVFGIEDQNQALKIARLHDDGVEDYQALRALLERYAHHSDIVPTTPGKWGKVTMNGHSGTAFQGTIRAGDVVEMGESAYRILCGTTHSQPWRLEQALLLDASGAGMRLRLDWELLTVVVNHATEALTAATLPLCDYLGIPADNLDQRQRTRSAGLYDLYHRVLVRNGLPHETEAIR